MEISVEVVYSCYYLVSPKSSSTMNYRDKDQNENDNEEAKE